MAISFMCLEHDGVCPVCGHDVEIEQNECECGRGLVWIEHERSNCIGVFIVQLEHGGIPEEPEVFARKEDANKRFLEVVKDTFGKEYASVDQCYEVDGNFDDDDTVRYWSVKVNR